MSKCQECKCNSDTTSSNEFNKNLCDDCYTEYRVTIQHMFGLKDLYDVDNLLKKGVTNANISTI
jgi:hypothetical protein